MDKIEHQSKIVVACDLDGTLAEYDGWKGDDHIGKVVPSIKAAIENVYNQGGEVWIFTARLSDDEEHRTKAYLAIEKWLLANDVRYSGITNIKHKFFTHFWDDRAIQVLKNEGVMILEADNHYLPAMNIRNVAVKDSPASAVMNAIGGDFTANGDCSGYKVNPIDHNIITAPFTPAEPASALDVQEGGNHYKKYKIQPIEFAHANNMPFLDANAFKYICRHADKNGVQDLRKAKHYLELIAEMVYGEKL